MNVAPGATYEAVFPAGITGLVGTLKLGVYDNQGAITSPLSTTGIIETPAGSGIYAATRTAPTTRGQYSLIWSLDGTTDPDQVSVDELNVGFTTPDISSTGSSYATTDQLAAVLPGITETTRADDLQRVLDMAKLEIDTEIDRETPFDFSDAEGIAAFPLLVHVNLERAADLWHMENVQSGLLLGGDTPLLAPRDSWVRYANMLAPLKSRWGIA